MCGITGYWQSVGRDAVEMTHVVRDMAWQLAHRGPDDAGEWVEPGTGVALGFRRLAIVDLSPTGHQPMTSASGRFEIIFNGEVYNFSDLRSELQAAGHAFRGTSDTEVILTAIESWGIVPAVKRFVGMFAIALWDRRERRLHLIRDRLGIKPLYYGWSGGAFLFGSELKSLAAHPNFSAEIDRRSLALYMRFGYVPAPYAIYSGIFKLPPGTVLTLHSQHDHEAQPEVYWSARDVTQAGREAPFTGTRAEAIAELDSRLREAVALRMIADVPLGAFLSGGVDSSTVVALMQGLSSKPVRTFTIGFQEQAYDEAAHAAAVARHLGTDHTTQMLTPSDALDVIPLLPTMYDEPFADPSQIPTYLVSRLAREHVTVSLSGDGGDELLGGYNRYLVGEALWRRLGGTPTAARQLGSRVLTSISPESWDRKFGRFESLMPKSLRQRNPGDKIHKLAGILPANTREAFYIGLVSQWPHPEDTVFGATEPPTVLTDESHWPETDQFLQRMMFLDLVSYLPDDVLAKVDRASMATSLEARVPLLDHRVVEFAASLPIEMNVSGGQGKRLLRDVLYQYVPRELVERPKMGFGVPLDSWLRGPLREWAEDLLDERRLCDAGLLNPKPIRKHWEEHLRGTRNWQYPLWTALQFQSWYLAQTGQNSLRDLALTHSPHTAMPAS